MLDRAISSAAPAAKTKRKPRAPVPRTDALLDEVVDWIASGQTLSDYCRQPGKPERRSIARWVTDDPTGFGARFAEARRLGHDVIAESTLALADAPLRRGPDGRADMAEVQQRRLQIDTRLRLLSKWDSGRYGDKLTVDGDGAGVRALIVYTGVHVDSAETLRLPTAVPMRVLDRAPEPEVEDLLQ